MYSLIAYFIAYKMIDITITGLEESKGVMIITDYPDEISEVLTKRLGRGVTVLFGEGGYSKQPKKSAILSSDAFGNHQVERRGI